MRAAAILMILVALPACTAMLVGTPASPERTPATAGGQAVSAEDTRISGEIRRRLNQDETLGGVAIGIRTVSARVTLTGTVPSYAARDRAVEIARSASGVRSVDSRIIVNTNR